MSRSIRLIALGQALIAHDVRARPYPGYEALCARLCGADVVISDLETAVHTEHAADPTRQGVFLHCAPPEVLDCLRALSINLLALANNHSYDLGAAGVAAAIAETKRRGFGHAGTGASLAQASAPGYLQTDAGPVALIAFASKVPPGSEADANKAGVNPLRLAAEGTLVEADRVRILAAITQAATEAQLVVACHHDHYWAPDWHETPPWKRLFARACIDAGAHAYVSHGVPLLHGIEIHRERPIFYGLGSFIFHTRTAVGHYEPAVWESVLAECTFRGGRLAALRLEPIVLNESGQDGPDFLSTRGRPALACGAHARTILERLRALSALHGTELVIRDGHAALPLTESGAP